MDSAQKAAARSALLLARSEVVGYLRVSQKSRLASFPSSSLTASIGLVAGVLR